MFAGFLAGAAATATGNYIWNWYNSGTQQTDESAPPPPPIPDPNGANSDKNVVRNGPNQDEILNAMKKLRQTNSVKEKSPKVGLNPFISDQTLGEARAKLKSSNKETKEVEKEENLVTKWNTVYQKVIGSNPSDYSDDDSSDSMFMSNIDMPVSTVVEKVKFVNSEGPYYIIPLLPVKSDDLSEIWEDDSGEESFSYSSEEDWTLDSDYVFESDSSESSSESMSEASDLDFLNNSNININKVATSVTNSYQSDELDRLLEEMFVDKRELDQSLITNFESLDVKLERLIKEYEENAKSTV